MARKNGIFSLAALAVLSAVLHADEQQVTVTYSIGIHGMTCETCSAHVQKELAAVPGVVKASVDYKAGHAWVTVEEPRQPDRRAKSRRIGTELAAVVEKAGYKPTVNYLVIIKGMTCEACSQHVQEALAKVSGVAASTVNYKGGYAVVVPSIESGPNPQNLVTAVAQAGYKAVVQTGP